MTLELQPGDGGLVLDSAVGLSGRVRCVTEGRGQHHQHVSQALHLQHHASHSIPIVPHTSFSQAAFKSSPGLQLKKLAMWTNWQ